MISRIRHSQRQDEGFTLIEVVVALGISVVIFSAMAAAGIAGVRASVVARESQHAVDVMNQIVEEARGEAYASVAMVTSDLYTNDSAISSGASPKYTVPNGIGAEAVWAGTTGSVSPHVEDVTPTGSLTTYTVKKYVTVPNGYSLDSAGQPNEKRLTILIEWSTYGLDHQRVISTLMTETTRGLPLPRYSAIPTSVTTRTVNPSTTLVWGFQVINRGARDAFNISASSGTWTYYVDENCDGAKDTGETTTLSNSDSATGDTRPDTGKLEPNNYPAYCVVAVRAVGASETGTSTVTFNLQSSAQPSASGASVAVGGYTVTVTNGSTGGSASPSPSGTSTAPSTVCAPTPAGAGTPFGFQNGTAGTSGATTSQLVNQMTQNFCMNQPTAANYSTEAGAGVGRSLTTGGTATSGTANQMAEWRWNPPNNMTVAAGTATVSVIVSCPAVGANLTLNAAVGMYSAKSDWTQKGTGTVTVSCATADNWIRVDVPVSLSMFQLKRLDATTVNYLSTRLFVSGGVAGQKLRLNYEQPNAKSFLYVNVS